MNTTEIKESGIFEAYLLGISSKEEQEYVKKIVAEDERLEKYLIDMETDVHKYFLQTAIPPPVEIRDIILLRNPDTEIQKKKHVFSNARTDEFSTKDTYLDIEVNDTYIKVHKYWRPAFIAVFILSKIFLIAGLYYYFKSSSMEQEIVKLRTEIKP